MNYLLHYEIQHEIFNLFGVAFVQQYGAKILSNSSIYPSLRHYPPYLKEFFDMKISKNPFPVYNAIFNVQKLGN